MDLGVRGNGVGRVVAEGMKCVWLPETGRWKDRRHGEKFKLLKMEFRTFVNTIIRMIFTTGHRTAARVLKFPRCRVFNVMHFKRTARFVRSCATQKQKKPRKRLSWVITWRAVGVSPPSCPHLTRRAYATPLAGFAATEDVTPPDCESCDYAI